MSVENKQENCKPRKYKHKETEKHNLTTIKGCIPEKKQIRDQEGALKMKHFGLLSPKEHDVNHRKAKYEEI